MRKAFDNATDTLSDMAVPEAERESRSHLFAGAIGSYKNPHSRRNVALDDPDEATENISLANHILRIVEARSRESGPASLKCEYIARRSARWRLLSACSSNSPAFIPAAFTNRALDTLIRSQPMVRAA